LFTLVVQEPELQGRPLLSPPRNITGGGAGASTDDGTPSDEQEHGRRCQSPNARKKERERGGNARGIKAEHGQKVGPVLVKRRHEKKT
jgi:hypothetical protein